MIGIYKIVSPSGRVYIGQSKDIERRFIEYNKLKCKKQRKLYSSFMKYGVDKHIFYILEECSIDELNIVERKWQDYYNVTSKNGLNLCLVNTEEKKRVFNKEGIDIMKKKLSVLLSGENNPFYGKKHSKESSIKMSNSRINNENALKKCILDLDTGIYYTYDELLKLFNMSYYKVNRNKEKYIVL
jgi:group I intron endonuclease